VLDDGATDSDQVEGGPGEDIFILGQTAEESLLVMRSEVFADGDRLLGRCLVEGNSLGPVVALRLCFVMFFGVWAGSLGDLALGREAVTFLCPGTKSLSMLRAACWLPLTVMAPCGPGIFMHR
jgi:hypothetical protein